MGTDIQGFDIYVLDSFDYLSTLISKGATFVAVEITDFNRHKLKDCLRVASGEDEFAEGYISLINEKHDMYIVQEISNKLDLKYFKERDPKYHPTYEDIEVRRGEVKPIEIKPGSFALISKSTTGCGWDRSWYFVRIVPKKTPLIDKDTYEEEFMKPWDGIRQMLLVNKDTSDMPRMNYEQSIDSAYELGYNKALGK